MVCNINMLLTYKFSDWRILVLLALQMKQPVEYYDESNHYIKYIICILNIIILKYIIIEKNVVEGILPMFWFW